MEQIQWFSGSGLEALTPCFATVFFCKWPKSSKDYLDAPPEPVAERAVGGGGLGQGDDPGLGMARLVDHGDIGRDPLPGQLDAVEHALASGEARGQRGLAAVREDQQILLQPQPPAPAQRAAQGDEVGGAVEAVAHQHDPAAGRKPSRHPRDQFPLLGEADGAPGLPDPPRQGQGPPPPATPGAGPVHPPTRTLSTSIWRRAETLLWSRSSTAVPPAEACRIASSAKGRMTASQSSRGLASRRAIHR